MIYATWFILAILNIFISIFAIVIAPILPAFVAKDGHLPSYLSWFDTPDNTTDGDIGWRTEHRLWRNDADVDTNPIKIYINRIFWLVRNNAYGFSYTLLNAELFSADRMVISGDPDVSNIPGHNGWVLRKIYRDGELEYWQFYFVKQYPFAPTKCFRMNLGWKLWVFKGRDVKAPFVSSIGFGNQFGP